MNEHEYTECTTCDGEGWYIDIIYGAREDDPPYRRLCPVCFGDGTQVIVEGQFDE